MPRKKLRYPREDRVERRDEPSDYTGDGPVADRVLVINLFFFKYGTSDAFQGAALLLALVILILAAAAFAGTLALEISDQRFDGVLDWLKNAFMIVAGVAIGRAAPKSGG